MTDTENGRRAWIGVDIGGTKTAIVLSVDPPEVISRVEFATLPQEGPDRAIQLIKKHVYESLAGQRLISANVSAIGVSCGGPLDRVTGVIQSPPNLSTWKDVPITQMFEDEFRVPCRLENDANAGAVAEHRFGAGKGARDMVFLTMGTGLGAGIITDGRLYHGTSDLAGEVGHIRLTKFGPVGHNKAGSAEGWASGGGMGLLATKLTTAAVAKGKRTVLAECLQRSGNVTAKDAALAAAEKDPLAIRIISSTGEKLGATLAILIDLLNPERIVVGGLAMRLGETILGPARKVVERESLAASCQACKIVSAELGERIGDVAALCIAMGF